jgi:hypothetical protein
MWRRSFCCKSTYLPFHDISDRIENMGRLVQSPGGSTRELMIDDGSSHMMLHPCQTVWTVGQLVNGDVITGGSDGRVRVWTKDESRYASAEIREVSSIVE